MATQAQIEANRRNARKSTGPKTPEGKARVSLNAPGNANGHGIRASAILDQLQRTPLWDEDPQEFADLVQAVIDEFHPVGLYEEMCVEDVAICYWRLRRVARAATAGSGGLHSSNEATKTGRIASAQQDILTGPTPNNPRLHARAALPDLDVLEKLNRYETSIRRQLDRSIATLATLAGLQASRAAQAPVETRDLASLPAQERSAVPELPYKPNSVTPPAGSQLPDKANPVETPQPAPDQIGGRVASDLACPALSDDPSESTNLPNKANSSAEPSVNEPDLLPPDHFDSGGEIAFRPC